MTTFDKMVTPKEDIRLSRLGTAEARDRCFLLLVQFVAIESPGAAAVCLS